MINLPIPFFGKRKNKDFLVIEIGLERVNCAVFQRENEEIKVAGVGRKKFSSPDEIFNSTIEALDGLAAIVPDFPEKGVLGVSGGRLKTLTTVAKYARPKPDKPISTKETQDALGEVIKNLGSEGEKIFFSSVAGANIDGVRVTNPVGLKGENIELSCFVAFRPTDEIALYERIVNEIDLKVEKIIPTSYTVAKTLEPKHLEDAILFRAGLKRSELAILIGGHVAEIFAVDLGIEDADYLPFAWQAALKDLKQEQLPTLVWVFADSDDVNVEKLKEILTSFPWSHLRFSAPPKIEVAESIANFSPSDIGLYALGQEGSEA